MRRSLDRTDDPESSTDARSTGPDSAGSPVAAPRERALLLGGGAVLLAFAVWRSTLGADLSDDGHVIALTLRLSHGARPFVDEMNIQALGSLPAVPFTWLWSTLFGTSGIVLASRLFFVCVAAGAAWVTYRALSTTFRPSIAGVAAVAPLMAPAYNLPVISYNTVPLLSLVVATAAGFAAVRRRSLRWAAVAGGVTVLGTIFYPPMVFGGSVLLLVVLLLSRSKQVTLGVIGAATLVAIPGALYYLVVIGPGAVSTTLQYTNQFLEARLTPAERWARTQDLYGHNIWRRRYWPAWGLALLACLPRLPVRLRAVFAGAAPVTVLAGSLLAFRDTAPIPFGEVVAVDAIIVCLVLVVPVVARTIADRRRDLGQLLAVALPAGLVQAGAILLTTSSGPSWGVPYIGLAPLFLAVVVVVLAVVEQGWPAAPAVAGGLLVVGLGLLSSLKPFKDPPPWELTARVGSGPFAGVVTTPATAAKLVETTRALEAVVRPDQTVLIYGNPGAYLLTRARPVTPALWLVNYGAANRLAVDYLERRGEHPDVVLIHVGQVASAGGWAELRRRDPLVEWFLQRYQVLPERSGPFYVLEPLRS